MYDSRNSKNDVKSVISDGVTEVLALNPNNESTYNIELKEFTLKIGLSAFYI